MASIKQLSAFDASEIAHIQAVERETLLPNRLRGAEVEKFIAEHGRVFMAYSNEGGYFHNAEPVSGFTSIILKAR